MKKTKIELNDIQLWIVIGGCFLVAFSCMLVSIFSYMWMAK